MPTYNDHPVLSAEQAHQMQGIVNEWFITHFTEPGLPTLYEPGHEGPMWVLSLEGVGTEIPWTVQVCADMRGKWPVDMYCAPVNDWCLGLYPEVPTSIPCDEEAAYREHDKGCVTCQKRRTRCREGGKLQDAYIFASSETNTTSAPIVTIDRYGRKHGCWNGALALALVGLFGGEILKAPPGLIEATIREQEREEVRHKEKRAAWRAAGRPQPPRPMRW